MDCPQCRGTMSYGSPHSEEIRSQRECHSCGFIDCEYYSPEEQIANRLVTRNFTPQEAMKIVVDAGYNERRAERLADEIIVQRSCTSQGMDADTVCRQLFNKPLSELTDTNLQVLTLKVQKV